MLNAAVVRAPRFDGKMFTGEGNFEVGDVWCFWRR